MDINSIVSPNNRVLNDSLSTHIEEIQTAEQLDQNEELVRTESLEEKVEEPPDSEFQMFLSVVQQTFSNSLAIVLTSIIVADDNN